MSGRQVEKKDEEREQEKEEEGEENEEEGEKKEEGGETKKVERGQSKPVGNSNGIDAAADLLDDDIIIPHDQLQKLDREGRNGNRTRRVEDNYLMDKHHRLKKEKLMVREAYEEHRQGRQHFCCVLL